uniref:Uncharacterized protein n=1 Tax=Brassica campestris TaxID=3711 RepID=A0A3P6AM14_BRACM|nr:unnamed protein product [Brassica rapa]
MEGLYSWRKLNQCQIFKELNPDQTSTELRLNVVYLSHLVATLIMSPYYDSV